MIPVSGGVWVWPATGVTDMRRDDDAAGRLIRNDNRVFRLRPAIEGRDGNDMLMRDRAGEPPGTDDRPLDRQASALPNRTPVPRPLARSPRPAPENDRISVPSSDRQHAWRMRIRAHRQTPPFPARCRPRL